MASSIRVKSLFAILVFLFEMKRNVLCAHDEDVTLCLSEFNQDKECNVRAEFGKEIQVYCPIDAEQTRNGGVVRMNGHEVNNDNTCFSKMKSNDTSNRNVIKKFEDYVQNLIMHTNDSDSTHYFQKREKNIKGCNFYYSEEEGQQKENSIEKNINVKYKKVCSVDVHANDVVSFRCRIHNRYSSVFVNPPLCFHDVSNENNEILQISGLLNEAKVIPRLTTYVHDPMMAKFLSYLVSPPHVNESLRVECTCTITDNVLDTSYVGTISLNFIKTDKLHPVQEEEDAEYRNRWKYSIDENEMENGENINNSSPRDGKKNARSSSVLTGLSVVLLLFLFLP